MRKFREAGTDVHTTILLGAGASVTSGLPDWDTFAARLLVNSRVVESQDAANLLLDRQDPLIALEAARVKFGKAHWESELRTALYQGTKNLDPSPLHLAAAGHALESDSNTTSLATLNFDTLLEQALEEETGTSPQVHHLHGKIALSGSHDVVLTLTDFTHLIAQNNTWQAEYLEDAVSRGALLIAGTSYRDPDLRQWLHQALQDKPEQHQALVLLAREAFGVSKRDFSQIKNALSAQWKGVGLEPVLLEDHSDAAQIIRELRYAHDPDYKSPQERARHIWDTHIDKFQDLQEKCADLLHNDAEVLKSDFSTQKMNLSLWISTGDGKLARWAAQDRTYRDSSTLREVETGHDSPWIAGQALSHDALLFNDLDSNGTPQWASVLAIPIPVPHPHFPALTSAVLTIGLSQPAEHYLDLQSLWWPRISEIADQWGEELNSNVYEAIK